MTTESINVKPEDLNPKNNANMMNVEWRTLIRKLVQLESTCQALSRKQKRLCVFTAFLHVLDSPLTVQYQNKTCLDQPFVVFFNAFFETNLYVDRFGLFCLKCRSNNMRVATTESVPYSKEEHLKQEKSSNKAKIGKVAELSIPTRKMLDYVNARFKFVSILYEC